jgi:hypothetical protein
MSLDPSAIRIAKRIAHEMLQISSEQIDLHFFMGVGIALAISYEEMTGRTAADKKPQELIQWAVYDLPDVNYFKVGPI